MSSILIVLVNWKRAEDTLACVDSIFSNVDVDFVLAVCDNASNDGSSAAIKGRFLSVGQEVERPQQASAAYRVFDYVDARGVIRGVFIENSVNSGFAAGNNLAYRAAAVLQQFDFVWFLNNDTEILAESVPALLLKMRSDESIGMCGATLIYAHDRKTVQALGGARYMPWTGLLEEVGQGLIWPQMVDEIEIEKSLDYISGASMFVSAKFLQIVGLMSEDYFLYFEELDWAQRARRAGFRLAYARDAVVYHKEGAALGSGKSEKRSALAEFYALRNRLRVTRKFFPLALPAVYLVSWLQVVRRIRQRHFSRARMMIAVLCGLRKEAP